MHVPADVPTVTSQDPPTVQLVSGDSITLSCEFTGVPPPALTWTHNGIPLVLTEREGVAIDNDGYRSELTEQRARGGVYRCTAINTVGNDSLQFIVNSEFNTSHYTPAHAIQFGLLMCSSTTTCGRTDHHHYS